MTPGWDAATYDRVSDPHQAWAQQTLDRLSPRGDETVLDAGCGSGRVTELLLERLGPDGRVVATDVDPDMVRHTRERFAERSDRVTVLGPVSLTDLVLDEPVDAVFSNAVFHWVLDHDALFTRLRAALKPGGRLVAQCGGHGNIDRVRSVPGAQGADLWHYATAQEAEDRLRAAGFVDARAWLEPWPVELGDGTTAPDARTYLEAVCLRDAPPATIDRVLAALGDPPTLDYVRLNLEATA